MKLFDYKCIECGHELVDHAVNAHDDEVQCPICSSNMEKQYTGLQVKPDTRHHRKLDSYKPGRGDANFGKL